MGESMVANEWGYLKKYVGEWVAVHNHKVVGHGKTLKEAYSQAKKVCRDPEVFQVPDMDDDVYLL